MTVDEYRAHPDEVGYLKARDFYDTPLRERPWEHSSQWPEFDAKVKEIMDTAQHEGIREPVDVQQDRMHNGAHRWEAARRLGIDLPIRRTGDVTTVKPHLPWAEFEFGLSPMESSFQRSHPKVRQRVLNSMPVGTDQWNRLNHIHQAQNAVDRIRYQQGRPSPYKPRTQQQPYGNPAQNAGGITMQMPYVAAAPYEIQYESRGSYQPRWIPGGGDPAPREDYHTYRAVTPDGQLLGRLDFSTTHYEEPEAHVEWVESHQPGVGSALLDKLYEEHPDHQIHLGMQTEEGAPFVQHFLGERPHLRSRTASVQAEDYSGTEGNNNHITRNEYGTVPLSWISRLYGMRGEYPGQHRNYHGDEWEHFKSQVAAGAPGYSDPIFVMVNHGGEPEINEGNHRRDAYQELGATHVPVQVRYFGHAEREGTLGERAGMLHEAAAIPVGRDDDDAYLRETFGVDPYNGGQLGGPEEVHPKSGYNVKTGLHRRLFIPKEGEVPAELAVDDHGSLEGFHMVNRDVAREPITHVYRGMSASEVDQALKQGHIKSDQRGTIADWEGTNAGLSPATARSYLSTSEPSVIAKIRVQPEDGWFAIPHDSYVRTRQPIPIDRIEALSKPYHYEPDPESRYGRTRLMREADAMWKEANALATPYTEVLKKVALRHTADSDTIPGDPFGQEIEMPESHKTWFAERGWTPREEREGAETFAPHFTKMMPSGIRHSLFWNGTKAFQTGKPAYQLESSVPDKVNSFRSIHSDRNPIFETDNPSEILSKAKDNEREWMTGERTKGLRPGILDFMKPDSDEYDRRYWAEPHNDAIADNPGQREFVEPKEKLHPLWRGGPGGRSGLGRLNAVGAFFDDEDEEGNPIRDQEQAREREQGRVENIFNDVGEDYEEASRRRDAEERARLDQPEFPGATWRKLYPNAGLDLPGHGHTPSDRGVEVWKGPGERVKKAVPLFDPTQQLDITPSFHDDRKIEPLMKRLNAAQPDESGLKAAGIAVIAMDTGRVLMQQRALNPLMCPCGLGVTWDEQNGYQHDDGSVSHDDSDLSVSDMLDQGHDQEVNDEDGEEDEGLQATAALEFDENEGTWEFPGGKIDPGESPRNAATREFREEVGQDLPPGVFVGAWLSPGGLVVAARSTQGESRLGAVDPKYLSEFHAYLDNEIGETPEEFAARPIKEQRELADSFGNYMGYDHPKDARYYLELGESGNVPVRTATPGRTVRVLRIEKPNGQGPFGYGGDTLHPTVYGDENHDVPYTLMHPLRFEDDPPLSPDQYDVRQRQPYADKIPERYIHGRVFGFLPQHNVGDYFNPHTLRGLHDLGYGVSQYDVPGEHVLLGRTQVAWKPEEGTLVSHTSIPEHFDLANMHKNARRSLDLNVAEGDEDSTIPIEPDEFNDATHLGSVGGIDYHYFPPKSGTVSPTYGLNHHVTASLPAIRGDKSFKVGDLYWHPTTGEVVKIVTHPLFRRRGIADNMFAAAKKLGLEGTTNYPLHSQDTTRSGQKWVDHEGGPTYHPNLKLEHTAGSGPVYKGFIYLIQRERDIDLGNRELANPDDPDGDMSEQSAWWEIEHAKDNPALREECKTGTPWDELELWADKSVRENKQVTAMVAKLAALPNDEQGWRDQFEALTDPLAEEGHGKDNSMWQHVQETLNDPEATEEQRDTARKLNDAFGEVDRRAQESAQWGRDNPGRVALFESNGFRFNPDSGRVRFEKTDENGWSHAIEPNAREGHYGTSEDSGVGWRVTANHPESFHGLGPDLRPIGGGKSRVLTAVTGSGADDDALALQLHEHNLEHSDFISHGWEPTRSAGEYLKKEDGAQHVAFPNRRTEAVPGYSPIIHERPGWNVNTTTFANPGDRVGKTTQTQYPNHLEAIIAHHPGTGMPHEAAAEKCMYCKKPSTKTIVHSEGMGKIPVCADHLAKGKTDAANCTPDGSHDNSNIDSVKTASGFSYPTGFPDDYVDPRPELPGGLRYHDAPDQPYQSVGNEDFWRFQDPTLIPPLNRAMTQGYQIGQGISHPRTTDVQPMIVTKPGSDYVNEEHFDEAPVSSPRFGPKTEVKWNDPICQNCYLKYGDIIPAWKHNTAMQRYWDDLGEEKHEFEPMVPETVNGRFKEAAITKTAAVNPEYLAGLDFHYEPADPAQRVHYDSLRAFPKGTDPDAFHGKVTWWPAGYGSTSGKIMNVAVHDTHKRKGLATELLRRAKAKAAETGLDLRHSLSLLDDGGKMISGMGDRPGGPVLEKENAVLPHPEDEPLVREGMWDLEAPLKPTVAEVVKMKHAAAVQKTAITWIDRHPSNCGYGCMVRRMKTMSQDDPLQAFMTDHRSHGGRVRWRITDSNGVHQKSGAARGGTLAENDMLDAYENLSNGFPPKFAAELPEELRWREPRADPEPGWVKEHNPEDKIKDKNPEEALPWWAVA